MKLYGTPQSKQSLNMENYDFSWGLPGKKMKKIDKKMFKNVASIKCN